MEYLRRFPHIFYLILELRPQVTSLSSLPKARQSLRTCPHGDTQEMNLKLNFKKEWAKQHPKLALSFRIRALIQLSLILSVLKWGCWHKPTSRSIYLNWLKALLPPASHQLLSRWRFLSHTTMTAEWFMWAVLLTDNCISCNLKQEVCIHLASYWKGSGITHTNCYSWSNLQGQ